MIAQNETPAAEIETRKTTRSADFAAFDSLPSRVRQALNECPLKLSAEGALDALRQGFSVGEVLAAIAEAA